MSELSFARTFLARVDTKPARLPADHVEDPRSYHARPPYILPRMAHSMSKPRASAPASASATDSHPTNNNNNKTQQTTSLAPPGGNSPLVSITLRSLRNPPLDVRLPPQPPATSVLDVRTAVAAQAGIPLTQLRLLHAKKPAADTKALRDLLPPGGAPVVELAVMVMGGAAAPPSAAAEEETKAAAAAAAAAAVAQGESGLGVLQTDGFWRDLRGFLQQRVRDEAVAEQAIKTFQGAWAGRS